METNYLIVDVVVLAMNPGEMLVTDKFIATVNWPNMIIISGDFAGITPEQAQNHLYEAYLAILDKE